jgi:hypothetical protein
MSDRTAAELIDASMKNHGTNCREWTAMESSLATSDCAKCGRSSTAHVVTLLCDRLAAAESRPTPGSDALDLPSPEKLAESIEKAVEEMRMVGVRLSNSLMTPLRLKQLLAAPASVGAGTPPQEPWHRKSWGNDGEA